MGGLRTLTPVGGINAVKVCSCKPQTICEGSVKLAACVAGGVT